ncbi:hypothetical protein PSHT_11026 [Puccinia striiformis]|uniref:Secreted protein n=1 Tax=Puccinia striiformis TaxID=27350 RepID=A0A2S4V624_9BASI|nr:hypothetical protein PSHT_11026 [Puccinia striiformis]
MYAGKSSNRGMICIIFLGMIATLSTVLAKEQVCDVALQTEDGGFTPGPGKAECLSSSQSYLCDLKDCQSGSSSRRLTDCE